jgi:magnesium chelatase subunit I
MTDVVATVSHVARQSPHISQRSGVSVRLSVANYEVMVANAARRTLLSGETDVVPRVSDLAALPAATAGKVEIESLEEGREPQILEHIVSTAVLAVFKERVTPAQLSAVVEAFEDREPVETGEDVPAAAYTDLLAQMPTLAGPVSELVGSDPSPGEVASAVELVLEGLHLSKRLNKDAASGRAQYRSRV